MVMQGGLRSISNVMHIFPGNKPVDKCSQTQLDISKLNLCILFLFWLRYVLNARGAACLYLPQIQRLCLNILEALAKDPDHISVMFHVNLLPALKNVREKYPDDFDVSIPFMRIFFDCYM